MKVRPPKPFLFEGGARAVLLLHAFTGNSADVRQLGRYLNKRGYTCYGPHYSGHAVPPEELVRTTAADWWHDVQEAYRYMMRLGYQELAVCGLSLGGVFSLRCGYTFPVKGLIPMCAPIRSGAQERIHAGVLRYAENYMAMQGKNKQEIAADMADIRKKIPAMLTGLSRMIDETRHHLPQIRVPVFIVQARQDEMINTDDAQKMYDALQSERKTLKWYEQATHVITLGAEKMQLNQDVYAFLESLDWSVS
ncbi:alpha/beta fold hydrolase [Sporolactobacillus sp. Y61]|jgi:carboxylesterase|uniref:Alpha/beta fold hydrolase n=1 Tax=Sporolactobacillus sp. Y61 TaxID=3160863 RepID=A0AAU8ICK5_9BACL|nr:alpha/beta fold hydrolase [Sporolactobacillus sp. THM19-2]RYL93604.1 alpha/beta fold hydrolase [Sporolactobacillus sp. THM19-2]